MDLPECWLIELKATLKGMWSTNSQYRAFLVVQMVKNLPAMQEIQVWPLGQEDPLEKGMTTHSSTSCLENPTDRGALQATVHGVTLSWNGGNSHWSQEEK